MKFDQFSAVIVSLVLLLGACASGGNQTATESPAASPSIASSPAAQPATSSNPSSKPMDHSASTHGGQVVETGEYHLEFVAVPEAGGTHLDLFLQTGDTHEAVTGATVQGQVQLPNGAQKTVSFAYDAEGKHYAAMLPETASGEYKVVILTDINGKKVNGRFSFTK